MSEPAKLGGFLEGIDLSAVAVPDPVGQEGGFGGSSETNIPSPKEGVQKPAFMDRQETEIEETPKEDKQEKPFDIDDVLNLKDENEEKQDGVQGERKFKIEGIDKEFTETEIKEFAQKGYEQNKSIEQFAQEKQEWEKNLNETVTQIENKYKQHDQDLQLKALYDSAFDHMKESNPDLYEEVQMEVNKFKQAMNNPILSNQMKAMQSRIDQLEGQLSRKSVVDGAKELYKEVESFKTHVEPQYKKLGLNVNWDKVNKLHVETGISVKNAVSALYGEQMQKLYQSKLKLRETELKASRRGTPGPGKSFGSTKHSALDKARSITEMVQILSQNPEEYGY